LSPVPIFHPQFSIARLDGPWSDHDARRRRRLSSVHPVPGQRSRRAVGGERKLIILDASDVLDNALALGSPG
jgi:hypothetical protein